MTIYDFLGKTMGSFEIKNFEHVVFSSYQTESTLELCFNGREDIKIVREDFSNAGQRTAIYVNNVAFYRENYIIDSYEFDDFEENRKYLNICEEEVQSLIKELNKLFECLQYATYSSMFNFKILK